MNTHHTAQENRRPEPAGAAPANRAATESSDVRARALAGLPVNEHHRELAGIRTAVLEGGEGPPIVLLHGPMAYAGHWMRVIPTLVKRSRVIAPDLPGHGASAAPADMLDRNRVIQWLGELIKATCSTPPVIIGQALGGAIAAYFASECSIRIRHLALVDALGLSAFQPAPEFGQALHAFLDQPTLETHEALWRQCASDLESLRHGWRDRWPAFEAYNLDRARQPTVRMAAQRLISDFGAEAIPSEKLTKITTPTTLIWGHYDRATPLAVAEAASKRYGWRLYIVDNAGDDPPIEQPDELLRALFSALGGGA